jgi:hypothetical protein
MPCDHPAEHHRRIVLAECIGGKAQRRRLGVMARRLIDAS